MMQPSFRRRPGGAMLAVFFVLLALLLVRYVPYGLHYYPQLDDYIQYHNYPRSHSFGELCQMVGLLTARPLAGVADYFLWGPLFDHMLVGVVLISALYSATVLMTRELLRRYVPVGPVYLVGMALLPLGMEGLYWMSASTRIVCSLFFAAAAGWLFARWLDTGRWYWGLAYLPVQLLPFGFYEQGAVLSLTLVMGLALLELPRRWKRGLLALWGPTAMVLYLKFTALMAAQNPYAARSELVLPNTPYYWEQFLPEVLSQFRSAFFGGGFYTGVRGLFRGMELLVSDGLVLWLGVVLLLCAALWALTHRQPPESRPAALHGLALVIGGLLALAPVTPFLILGNPWFSLRGTVPSFCGIALIADALVGLVGRRWREVPGVLAAVLALVCSVASLSELHDYRAAYQYDQQVGQAVVETIRADRVSSELRMGILNVPGSAPGPQNYPYHEHIHSCCESDWAFHGLLTALMGEEHPSVTPLPPQQMYQNWNHLNYRPESFDVLYYYDGTDLIPVRLEQTGPHAFTVLDGEGHPLGSVWEDEGHNGYFEPA